MIFLTILGAIFVAAGLFGLGYCILEGYRVRGAQLGETEIRARLNRLVAINLGSVGGAALGLGLIVLGLTF